ncbi:MAG TPA: hypothetical protein VIX59_01115 [Candidatus Binataceae bacterium]
MRGIDRQLPFLSFYALTFAALYAVPLFLLKRFALSFFGGEISYTYVVRALELSLVGILCLYAGYYGPLRWLFPTVIPRVNLGWTNVSLLKRWGLVFSAVGIGFVFSNSLFRLPESMAQIGGYGADLCTIGILMLFALQLVGCLDGWSKILLWTVLIPIRLAIGLSGGLLSAEIGLALGLGIAYAAIRRVMPWKMIALGVVLIFFLRPLETPYREYTWGAGKMSNLSRIEKLSTFVGLARRAFEDPRIRTDFFIQTVAMRMAEVNTFAAVIRATPGQIPYWRGESFYPLLFKPIPRFVYPAKPEDTTGSTFPHRYGFLDQTNTTTSFNLPQLVELYCNFGIPGVVIGMFLYGLLYRVVLDVFVHRGMGLGAVVAAIYLSMSMATDTAASLALGGLVWELVFIALIHFLIAASELDVAMLSSRRA